MLKKMILTTLILSAPISSLMAEDAIDGKALTETNCTRCHGSEVYTRPNHRVQDVEQLATQVARCNHQLNTLLFDDDLDAIVKHLNESYYKFK